MDKSQNKYDKLVEELKYLGAVAHEEGQDTIYDVLKRAVYAIQDLQAQVFIKNEPEKVKAIFKSNNKFGF